MQYYYLIASLPYLELKMTLEYSVEDFFKDSVNALKEEHYKFLEKLHESKTLSSSHPLISKWLELDNFLKYNLALFRAELLGLSKDKYLSSPYYSPYYLNYIKALISNKNPYEVESELDNIRWQFLSDLEIGHYFDFERVVIYFLKLKIINRRASFKRERGEDRFNEICEKLYFKINQKYSEEINE